MARLRLVLLLLLIPVVALAWFLHRRATRAPEVPFAKVKRETLVSTLVTNGKVEPSDWVSVRAERPGIIERVDVQKGQHVDKGALLVELDARDAKADVMAADAAVAQAKAQLETVTSGGPSSSRVEIENALARDRLDLKVAQRDYESLRRLQEKQAATAQEVSEARQRVDQLQADIEALERKRAALVGSPERAAADAKLREAQASLEQARARLERSHLHSPIGGVVYDLPAREGAYLNVGDVVANVGNLSVLRVRVYVDEPELGRVAQGMPVTITWDALPGRQWKGSVEKMPTQVVQLGTRQVGEVVCTIDNPNLELIPGTNINAEIQSQVVENGLTIPNEAIRREAGKPFVLVYRDGVVHRQPVKLGATSVTRAVVLGGLREGDLVALTTEQPLTDGEKVEPVAGT